MEGRERLLTFWLWILVVDSLWGVEWALTAAKRTQQLEVTDLGSSSSFSVY